MADTQSFEVYTETFRQRMARAEDGHADGHTDAERLRIESRRLAERYASVHASSKAEWHVRRAALNLLEDAEEARVAERRESAERQRADAALRTSEEKYRALFERMDEGYCVIEMIFDEAGRAVDFTVLDANPAFAVQTGQRMVGRRIREVVPTYEQGSLDHYGRVATTGESVRFEAFVSGLGRWFEASAFRLGEGDSRRVAVLFTNVTERKETEERLRRAAAADAFRVALADALRPLHDPAEIQAAAAETLGRYLGASRVHYAELDGEILTIERGYTDGVPVFVGRFPFGSFAPAFTEALRAGHTLVVPDVAGYPGVDPEHRRSLCDRSVAAVVGVPLVKSGRLVGALTVHQAEPRAWTTDEVKLVEEVAERLWAAVERARTQAALRESEATVRESEVRFRTLTDAVPQVIWANETGGKATYFNRRWFDYSGLSLQQSVGPGWQAIVHLDDAPGAGAGWQRALAAGEIFDAEYRLRRADGAYRWHLGRNVPLRDGAGGVVGWFGTATDIHDLKEAEAAFAAAQERLRLIVESAHEHAIISLDRECRVTSWNPGAERMFGYRADEISGRSIEAIFTPEDRAAGLLETETRRALAEGRSVGERWHLRSDGTLLWTNCALMPMNARPGGEPIGFVKIMRDETEALEARQALEQSSLFLRDALRDTERARAEAEAAGQAKDHFLAVLSHELRTPLMPIQMALGMLSRRQDLPAPVRAAHEMIERNVELEAHFIDDMLDMTRIARGKMEVVREDMDLHEAARRAVEVSLPDIEAKRQRLTVAFDAPDHRLSGDPARLQQAMWNLLKNASKFTPEGGEISLRTRSEPGGRVVVEVADSGIGMEPAVIERIFRPFEQADVSITQQFGGLGLGLAIAKGTVDAHGGDLRADSAGPGRGATFTLSLPL